MTPLVPGAPGTQPAGTAMRLAVKDELRSLRFNLAQGAHWLQDLGGALAGRSGMAPPAPVAAPLDTLQHLLDATAQQALTGYRLVRHSAAAPSAVHDLARPVAINTFSTVSTLGAPVTVELLPPAACFADPAARLPSKRFTDMFYRLIRRVLETEAGRDAARSPLIVRQQAVDQAYWRVLERHAALVARVRGSAEQNGLANPGDHAWLCGAMLQALMDMQPLRDPSLPPWADRALTGPDQRTATLCLLSAVLACGLAQDATGIARSAADGLRLGVQLAGARIASVEQALGKPRPAEALAAEMAFIFRHA